MDTRVTGFAASADAPRVDTAASTGACTGVGCAFERQPEPTAMSGGDAQGADLHDASDAGASSWTASSSSPPPMTGISPRKLQRRPVPPDTAVSPGHRDDRPGHPRPGEYPARSRPELGQFALARPLFCGKPLSLTIGRGAPQDAALSHRARAPRDVSRARARVLRSTNSALCRGGAPRLLAVRCFCPRLRTCTRATK